MHTPKRTRRLPHETTRRSRRGGEKKRRDFFVFCLQCVCASLITNLSRDTDRARIRRLLCDSRKKADDKSSRARRRYAQTNTFFARTFQNTHAPCSALVCPNRSSITQERDASTLVSSVLLLAFLAFYTFYFHQNYLPK